MRAPAELDWTPLRKIRETALAVKSKRHTANGGVENSMLLYCSTLMLQVPEQTEVPIYLGKKLRDGDASRDSFSSPSLWMSNLRGLALASGRFVE